jgi:hypothetical protein
MLSANQILSEFIDGESAYGAEYHRSFKNGWSNFLKRPSASANRIQNDKGYSKDATNALILVCRSADVKRCHIEELVKSYCADPNGGLLDADFGESPLYCLASSCSSSDAVEELILNGADINRRDRMGTLNVPFCYVFVLLKRNH